VLKEEQGIDGDPWWRKLCAIQERVAACGAPPPERRDAAEHRQHILVVARRLFAERGVDEVSMQQIARAAGVGQGTLYRRYTHKGELCMALLGENVARVGEELREYLASCGPSTPARAQLDYVLSRHVAFNEENAPLLSAMIEASCGHRRAAQYDNPIYLALHGTVETLLQRAVARGELPPLDTVYVTDAILAALAIDLYIHQRTRQGFTPERIMAAIRQLYIDGLCADRAVGAAPRP
jgi:AcrR family transcriptional regulator